jgi:hypothetical protein
MIARFSVLLSLARTTKVDPLWFWFTALVGLNLFPSAFSPGYR